MKVRCKSCRWEKDIVEGERFCGRCGALLDAEPEQSSDDLEWDDEVTLSTARDMPRPNLPSVNEEAGVRHTPPPPPPVAKGRPPATLPPPPPRTPAPPAVRKAPATQVGNTQAPMANVAVDAVSLGDAAVEDEFVDAVPSDLPSGESAADGGVVAALTTSGPSVGQTTSHGAVIPGATPAGHATELSDAPAGPGTHSTASHTTAAKPTPVRPTALPQALPPKRPLPPHQNAGPSGRPLGVNSQLPSRSGSLTPTEAASTLETIEEVETLEETPLMPDGQVTTERYPEFGRKPFSTRPDTPTSLRRRKRRFSLTPLFIGAALGTGAVMAVRYQAAQHADEQAAQAAASAVKMAQARALGSNPERTEQGSEREHSAFGADSPALAADPANAPERSGPPSGAEQGAAVANNVAPAFAAKAAGTTEPNSLSASRVSAARHVQESGDRPAATGTKLPGSSVRAAASRTAPAGAAASARATAADGEGEGPDLDEDAAREALDEAVQNAASCKGEDGPTGNARVAATFGPSGRAMAVSVIGGAFTGTVEGECIAAKFRAIRLPPFNGERVTLYRTVSIR